MKSRELSIKAFVLTMLMAGIALLVSGCESSSDEEATSSIQIQGVTASPSSIEVGASSIVEALVTNNGQALTNRTVTFSVPSAYGSCTPAVDTSDNNGIVGTVFTATQAGSAVITVTLSDDVYGTVTVNVTSTGGGPSAGNITITAVPTTILADGIDSTLVTVTVRDIDDAAAPDGTTIKMVAGEKFDDVDGNGYFTSGVDSVIYDVNSNGEWDPNGSISSSISVAGGAGQATAYYYSGTFAGTVYLRATVDATGYAGFSETTVQLSPDATISSIYMDAESMHIAVKRTGGLETTTLNAIGYDYNGNRVPEGLPISFMITDGPDDTDDGEHLANLTGANRRGPYTAVTNGLGVATCPISSGTVSGTIRVRCYADTVMSEATQLLVHAGPPARIDVGAEDCNVPCWDIIGCENKIVALVSDIYNNPCPDSTVVYFTCDEGVIEAHDDNASGTVYLEEGIAETWWRSRGPDGDGIVELIAETAGGTVVDTGYFINSFIPDTMWFTSFPIGGIMADGKSKGFFRMEYRDLNDLFIDDLSEVKFSSDFVTIVDRENCDGCYCSSISGFIVADVLDRDYSLTGAADDGIGAVLWFSSYYTGLSADSAQLLLLTGPTYSKNSSIDVVATLGLGESVPFTVIIQDRAGNPLGDHMINCATIGGGSITNGSQRTNTYGEATGFVLNAPGVGESVIITAQDIDPLGGVTITKEVSLE